MTDDPAGRRAAAFLLFAAALLLSMQPAPAFAGAPEIGTSKDVYAAGETVEIRFANVAGGPQDWIAVARPDHTPRQRVRRILLRGATAGEHRVSGLRAGEYELRLFQGGSFEIVARTSFRIVDPSTRAGASPEASEADDAAETVPHASDHASAVELSTELQRLVGIWLVHTRCDTQGNGQMRPQEILLEVRPDGAKPSGLSAEVRGITGTAGIALDIAFDGEEKRYRLTFAGWLPGSGYHQKPFGLTLAFPDRGELLHGQLTERTDCQSVVAGRVPSENAPPNHEGLLYKVAVNRVLTPLTEPECAAYGQWLASGDTIRASSLLYSSAVTDGPAMRRLFGHDLEGWTDEDARKILVIHKACQTLLRASVDPALVNLANRTDLWRGIPPPLRSRRSIQHDHWRRAYFALHRALLQDIRTAWQAIEEGLVAQRPGTVAVVPRDSTGLAGEWRGHYRCAGGNEIFMRLTVMPGDGPLEARVEFGSGLRTNHPFGVLAMVGKFDAPTGRITLDPGHWIQQPRQKPQPLGFEGRLRDGGVIQGEVKGNPDCPEFEVTRREVHGHPVNPGGLLFRHLGRDMITATVAQCRVYAEWLAEGESIDLVGGSSFFSGLRDGDAMRTVLGKDFDQWSTDDSMKMRGLAHHCQKLMESQMDPEIAELIARVRKTVSSWAPTPLTTPRDHTASPWWLRIEQLIMVNEQQQALAARKLAEAEAMPPTIGGIDGIDALVKEATTRVRGPFQYLSKQELRAYLDGLSAARITVAVAAADARAQDWSSQPQTYAALRALEGDYETLRDQLRSRKAPHGMTALAASFRREAARRADALWPEVLQTGLDELRALAKADLLRFRELSGNQEQQAYLVRFHAPTETDRYFASYQSARALYRETVDRMVERSTPRLLAWIKALPPSARAGDMLDEFAGEVFGSAAIPERHRELRDAAAAKKRSYNPDGYARPDIVMSLRRGQWNEVGLIGLEDLAYMTTSLRAIKESCPGVVPEGLGPLMSFTLRLSEQSVRRIMQGQVQSRREAERALFLFFNNVINRPGCQVDYFGNIVGCVTPQEHAAAQGLLLTSTEALVDMQTLMRAGCGPAGAQGYVQGLIAYAESYHRPRSSPAVRDFWRFEASPGSGR